MKRIVRLTENDLTRIVKRVLNEYEDPNQLAGLGSAAAAASRNPDWQVVGKSFKAYKDSQNKEILGDVIVRSFNPTSEHFEMTIESKESRQSYLGRIEAIAECGDYSIQVFPSRDKPDRLQTFLGIYPIQKNFNYGFIYNNKFINWLTQTWCKKGGGGKMVPATTDFAQSGQGSSSNFS